jgi:hypothetical protein
LFEYDGSLFCGHDSGTFIVKWHFKNIFQERFNQKDFASGFLVGKVNNQWRYRNKISGLIIQHDISKLRMLLKYVSHEYKGVLGYSWIMNSRQNQLLHMKQPKEKCGLTKFNNSIYYAYKGIFKLNNKTKLFEKDKV